MLISSFYLWSVAIYNIIITEWDHDMTIEFLQGTLRPNVTHFLHRDVISGLVTALNFVCGFQVFAVTFFLMHGAFLGKKHLISKWLYCHTFILAFYLTYLFSGTIIFTLTEDKDKVILLLYGAVNIMISICVWSVAYQYYTSPDEEEEEAEQGPEHYDI